METYIAVVTTDNVARRAWPVYMVAICGVAQAGVNHFPLRDNDHTRVAAAEARAAAELGAQQHSGRHSFALSPLASLASLGQRLHASGGDKTSCLHAADTRGARRRAEPIADASDDDHDASREARDRSRCMGDYACRVCARQAPVSVDVPAVRGAVALALSRRYDAAVVDAGKVDGGSADGDEEERRALVHARQVGSAVTDGHRHGGGV